MILTKSFSKEHENQFLKSEQFTSPQYIREIFLMFIFFYGLFFLVDLAYFPDEINLLIIIRFGLVIPVLLSTIVLTFTKYFYKFNQQMVALSFFVGGSGVAYMLVLQPDNIVYNGGLFIVIFSGYLLVKLRFIYATIAGTFIILFYILGHVILLHGFSSTLIYSLVFLVSANLIGMVGAYNIEKSNRQHFLYTLNITNVNDLLKQQYAYKKEQLELLEKSIKENKILQEVNSENQRLTQELKKSESKFRKLFEHAPFGYQSLDDSGCFLEVNKKWLELLGYQKEEVIGKWFGDFLSTEMKEHFKKRFELFKQNGHTHSAFAMKNKQGELMHVSFDGNISYDDDHNMIQTHCTISDTTEIHLTNMKLKQSEEQYRLLTTEMQLGLALHEIICDESGKPIDYRFIHVNPSFENLTGLKKEEIIGKTVMEVLPKTETYWIETYGDVALNNKTIQYENYSTELDKYFSISAYSPKKGQFAVIIEDITNRISLENERKKEQKDLLTSQKIARLGTWRLNVATNEVTWSEELYKMYGFDPNQPVPPYTEHMKLFTKPSWEKLSKALALTSTKGIPYELELETIDVDGTNGWMWVRGEAEYDNEGHIVSISGAAQDITDRRQLEQELNNIHQINSAILDKSPVAIEFFDTKGNLTYSNDSAIELFGVVDPNEIRQINLFSNPNLSKELLTKILSSESLNIEIEYDFEKIKESKLYQTSRSGVIILDLSITQLYSFDKLSGYIIHSKDVTEQKTKASEILHISNYDFLTDIPNRRFFSDHLDKLDSIPYYPLGIMMLDINGLKLINDSFGYENGDLSIKRVAQVIKNSVRQHDIVARLGGDEFGILLPNITEIEILELQQKMSLEISNISIMDLNISISMGASIKYDQTESINKTIKNAEENMYKKKVLEGRSMRSAAIKTILETLTNKYEVEKVHSEKVSEYCYAMGKVMNLTKDHMDELKLAGLLHDIGKISIPDRILTKPGKLDQDEWEIMKKHTIYGYNILRAADEYSNLALYALTHHEKYDGTGYPKGLSKDEIPLFSRIISVIDAYEAMTADRPYRKAPGKEFAVQELIRCKNTQFDPHIVDLFLSEVLKWKQ